MSLKELLTSITKGTSSVSDYLRSICFIVDELSFISHPIYDIDLVITAIKGLKTHFSQINASIRAQDSPFSFDELYEKLVDFEIFLQHDEQQ